jgi:hypothetical protein
VRLLRLLDSLLEPGEVNFVAAMTTAVIKGHSGLLYIAAFCPCGYAPADEA